MSLHQSMPNPKRTKKVTNHLHIFEGGPSSEYITDLIDMLTCMRDGGMVKVEMNLLRNGAPIYNAAQENIEVQFSGVKYVTFSDDEYLSMLSVTPEKQKEIYEILKSKYENTPHDSLSKPD